MNDAAQDGNQVTQNTSSANPNLAAVYDLHLQDHANAHEAVGHEADQRPVAQTHKIGFFYDYAVLIGRLSDRNAI